MKRKIKFIRNSLGKRLHSCGQGFRGEIIKARGIVFCGFCGKEFSKKVKA